MNMPELPEVETITQNLRRRLVGWRIVGIWTDWPKYFKSSGGFNEAEQFLIGRKIVGLERRGKNVLFHLIGGYILAVHLKMTGHFLFGGKTNNPSEALAKGGEYPKNIHVVLDLKKGNRKEKLYFSDARKFGRIMIGKSEWVLNRPEIKLLGPDPLNITASDFLALAKRRKGKIKSLLLNQNFLAGVGNIYSDEALHLAKIHPLSRMERIPKAVLKLLFKKLVWILRKSLSLKGSSRRDYRLPSGERGDYYSIRLVYDRKGEKCKCGGVIQTAKIGSRTSHFCPKCQIPY